MKSTIKIHFKGLNGIRAIASLSVVFSHIGIYLDLFNLPARPSIELAGYGVSMFFSLSGFLITYLLLAEKNKFGDINIRKFYIRRILRIWPLYYFYLIVAVIVILVFYREAFNKNLLVYFFLSANIPLILNITTPFIFHYWSLGVEEQFYIFWPWIIKKTKKPVRFIFLLIIVLMGLKFIAWIYYIKTGNSTPQSIIHITRFHCMGMGALGAIFFYQNNQLFLNFTKSLSAQLIAWGSILLMVVGKFNIASLINDEIVSALTVVLIINLSSNPKTIINLNYKLFDYLGKISFGIYIYHPLIIFATAKFFNSFIKGMGVYYKYVFIYTTTSLLTIIVAGLSYGCFEKRFLLLKEKYSPVPSLA